MFGLFDRFMARIRREKAVQAVHIPATTIALSEELAEVSASFFFKKYGITLDELFKMDVLCSIFVGMARGTIPVITDRGPLLTLIFREMKREAILDGLL